MGAVALATLAGLASFAAFRGDGPNVYTTPTSVPPSALRLSSDPETDVSLLAPLPTLDRSDMLVRNAVTNMTAHPSVAAWLIPDDLIRLFVVVIDNIADGVNPAEHLDPLRPTRRFAVSAQSRTTPATPARYDTHAEIITAIDPAGAAKLYQAIYPLLAEAYAELGNPDAFDVTVRRALVNLLDTPVVGLQVPLLARESSFEFADQRLEALLPVQKQFLGMGPRNVRAVQSSLLAVAREIGLDITGLSLPVVIQ